MAWPCFGQKDFLPRRRGPEDVTLSKSQRRLGGGRHFAAKRRDFEEGLGFFRDILFFLMLCGTRKMQDSSCFLFCFVLLCFVLVWFVCLIELFVVVGENRLNLFSSKWVIFIVERA